MQGLIVDLFICLHNGMQNANRWGKNFRDSYLFQSITSPFWLDFKYAGPGCPCVKFYKQSVQFYSMSSMCGVFTRGAFATEPFEDVEKGNIS